MAKREPWLTAMGTKVCELLQSSLIYSKLGALYNRLLSANCRIKCKEGNLMMAVAARDRSEGVLETTDPRKYGPGIKNLTELGAIGF